jgi:hypothetical protein
MCIFLRSVCHEASLTTAALQQRNHNNMNLSLHLILRKQPPIPINKHKTALFTYIRFTNVAKMMESVESPISLALLYNDAGDC